jgi:hypothetical protein
MVKCGKEKRAKDHDLDGKRPTIPMIPLCTALAIATSFFFIHTVLQEGTSAGFLEYGGSDSKGYIHHIELLLLGI